MANINDVARLAGVAKSTVSNVFHKKGYLSEEIINRVNTACEVLNYRPSFAAASLAGQQTGMFGFFLGTEGDIYISSYAEVITGMMLRSAQKGMHLVLYFAVSRKEMAHIMEGKGPIDGAVLMVPVQDDYRAACLSDQKIKTVMIGTPSGNTPDTLHVDVDNVSMTYSITKRFIEQGYKTFILVNSRADYSVTQERNSGFYKALQEYEIDPKNCIVLSTVSNKEEVYRIAKFYLASYRRDVVLLDVWCDGASAKAFSEAGFTEEDHCRFFQFDRVEVDYRRLGEEAFDLLYTALTKEEQPESRLIPYTIHWE